MKKRQKGAETEIMTEQESLEMRMKKQKRKKIIKRCIVLCILALIVAGVVYRNATAESPGLAVQTHTVETGDIEETLSTSGTVESEMSKSYFPPTEVVVQNLQISLGDAVRQGDQLLEFNTEDAEFKERTAALQASSSRNGYAGSLYDSREQEQKYIDAQNNLLTVEPMIISQKQYIEDCESWLEDDISRKKVDIYHEQYKLQKEINSLSEEQSLAGVEGRKISRGVLESMEHAQNEMEKLDLELRLLDEDMELTQVERAIVKEKNKLADLEEYKAKQEAIRDSAEPQVLNGYEKGRLSADNELVQIQLEQAQRELEEAKGGVIADFNGIVTELSVQDGSQASPEMAILKLESSDLVKVNFQVSKYDLEKLSLGQKATIDISGHTYEGTVSKINRMATVGNSGVPVVGAEIHIDNPDDYIYLGVEAKLQIHTAKSEAAVLVPIEAVGADREGDFCYVIEDGVAVKRHLEIGIASDSYMEVLSGLSAGDEVILDTMSVMEGMQVIAMPEGGMPETETPEAGVSEEETEDSESEETE